MAEKLEDLILPGAPVARIIKESLPEQITIGKDARASISRAASVFVLYISSQASQKAQRAQRKTLLGQDVLKALEELEFDDFIEPLEAVLREIKNTKPKKTASPTAKNVPQSSENVEDEEEEIVEEDMENGNNE